MSKPKSAYSQPTKFGKQDHHIIVVWVDNEAGVLARVIGLFSGRGYNIESLAVAEIDKKNAIRSRGELDKISARVRYVCWTSAGRAGQKLGTQKQYRSIFGGVLVQELDNVAIEAASFKVVTNRQPTSREMQDMLFAWKIVRHVKSNAIVFAKDEQTLGIGSGQTSRVDSSEIAVSKAAKERQRWARTTQHGLCKRRPGGTLGERLRNICVFSSTLTFEAEKCESERGEGAQVP